MKKGLHTTEFWWAVLVLLVSSMLLYTHHIEPMVWAAVNGFNGGVYTWSRAKVKSTNGGGLND